MKFIFSLGAVNKRLCLPFFLSLAEIIINVSDYLFDKYEIKSHQIMDSLGIGLGGMSCIFIPCILKYKKEENEKICSKKNVKYISIFIAMVLIYYGIFTYFSLSSSKESINDPHVQSLFTREAFEIIIITIITFLFLKYKYYIHNIISLIIFCILSAVIDIVLKNYESGFFNLGFKTIIGDVLIIICELICFCYQTYLMNNLYYNYWTIAFVISSIILTLNLVSIIVALIIGNPEGENNFFNNFCKFIKEGNPGYIVLRIIIAFVFKGFAQQLFRVLTLDYLSPNHILISYEIIKMLSVLTNPELGTEKWYSLIPFIFQFMSLFFYLEIFEYNFCGLNKNTKRNIQKREKVDMFQRDSVLDEPNNNLDIGHGYLINKNDAQIENEMQEMPVDSFIDENNNEEEIEK